MKFFKQLIFLSGLFLCASAYTTELPYAQSDKGFAKLLTPAAELKYQDGALLVGGRGKPPEFTMENWYGESGTIAFNIAPVNWRGDGNDFVTFFKVTDAVNGNFLLYKFGPNNQGLWFLSSVKNPQSKEKIHFPILDRTLLQKWTPGGWHHLALVWQLGKYVKLYIGGKLECTGNIADRGPQKFTKFITGPQGMGDKSESMIKDIFIAPKALSDDEVALLHNKLPAQKTSIIPVAPVKQTPELDGLIKPGEYSTNITGFCDNSDFCLSDLSGDFHIARDNKNLYIAASIELPENISLQSASGINNDGRLVNRGDLFVLFLAEPSSNNKKQLSGYYVSIAPNGIFYSAKEIVDWQVNSCQRTPVNNFSSKCISRVGPKEWVVETVIPLSEIPFFTQDNGYLSAGFMLNGKRLSLNPQLIWFDHYEGGFKLLSSQVGIRQTMKPANAGLVRGSITVSGAEAPVVACKIANPSITREHGGMVVEKVIDEKLKVSSQQSEWTQSRQFKSGINQLDVFDYEHQLKKPGLYLLSAQVSQHDKLVFNRDVMFRYHPLLAIDLKPKPSADVLYVNWKCHLNKNEFAGASIVHNYTDAGGKTKNSVIENTGVTGTFQLPLNDIVRGKSTITASLKDHSEKLLAVLDIPFFRPESELWRVAETGLEALVSDWVPAPWTPVKISGNTAEVWARKYDYSKGIFGKIISRGVNLLARPVELKYCLAGDQTIHTLKAEKTVLKPLGSGRISVDQTFSDNLVDFHVSHTLEFDGFNLANCELEFKKDVEFAKLWIEFPFKNMKYLQSKGDGVETLGEIVPLQYRSFPILCLSNDKGSCNILAESCRGWFIDSREPRVTLTRDKDITTVKLLIINTPGIPPKNLAFQWMLQAGVIGVLMVGLGLRLPPI